MGQNVNYPLNIFKSSKISLKLIELHVNVGKTKVIDTRLGYYGGHYYYGHQWSSNLVLVRPQFQY